MNQANLDRSSQPKLNYDQLQQENAEAIKDVKPVEQKELPDAKTVISFTKKPKKQL